MVVLFAGSLLTALGGGLMTHWKGDAYLPLVIGGTLGFFVFGLVSLKFPQCPNCGTAVNMPETSSNGRGIGIAPERSGKECGYCGQDLT